MLSFFCFRAVIFTGISYDKNEINYFWILGGDNTGIFARNREEKRNQAEGVLDFRSSLMGDELTEVKRKEALSIPTVFGAVELISSIIASMPVRLYKYKDGAVEEIKNDRRLTLLNDETGDLVGSLEMKKQMTRDYLLSGNGFSYIYRQGNRVKSLHYVETDKVSVNFNQDPIFKEADILVNGRRYLPMDFLKITRNASFGLVGRGLVDDANEVLSVAYNTLKFENHLIKTGGGKTGFLKAKHKLSDTAMERVKNAWKKLFKNNTETVMVLNEGMDFQEASNTLEELQLNENKKTNNQEICKLFSMAPSILSGNASDEDRQNFINFGIMPIVSVWQSALNQDLLLEREKQECYFILDTRALVRGDIEKTFNAYKMALEANIMQLDEVRDELELPPTGLKFMRINQSDVLVDMKTMKVYSANTNEITDLSGMGGDKK